MGATKPVVLHTPNGSDVTVECLGPFTEGRVTAVRFDIDAPDLSTRHIRGASSRAAQIVRSHRLGAS